MLDFDPLNAALLKCVEAAGGTKQVAHKLWPEKTVDSAARHLANCLNESRLERLTPEQVVLVARWARERGCHAYMHYLSEALSYAEPVPVAPRDEADELRRQLLETSRQMQAAMARLEALEIQRSGVVTTSLQRVA